MVVFSDTKGIFHPYYVVALAPGVAALAAGGAVALWQLGRRSRPLALLLPAAVVGSAVWAVALLGRTPGYDPGLSTVILVGAVLSAVALLLVLTGVLRAPWVGVLAGTVAAASLLAGPAAFSLTTVNQAAGTGGNPAAGPATGAGGFGGFGGGGAPGRGGSGQVGSETSADTGLTDYLEAHRDGAEYLVAVDGSMSADSIIVATGDPVMAMGGFTGSDPWPTLSAFKHLVATGAVRYVLVGGGGLGGGGGFAGGGTGAGRPAAGSFAGPRGGSFGPPGGNFGGTGGPRGSGGNGGAGGGFGGGPVARAGPPWRPSTRGSRPTVPRCRPPPTAGVAAGPCTSSPRLPPADGRLKTAPTGATDPVHRGARWPD